MIPQRTEKHRASSAPCATSARRNLRRSKSVEPARRWMDARYHATHWGPDGSWWLTRYEQPRVGKGFFDQDPDCKTSRVDECLPSYHGFATSGPSCDMSVLKSRQAALGCHVDWVCWAKEADDALRFTASIASSSPHVPKRLRHPDASWCPNYGIAGPDGRLLWPPSTTPQSPELHGFDKIKRSIRHAFSLLLVGDKSAWCAASTAVIDILDRLDSTNIPNRLWQSWWQFRTRVLAMRKSDNCILWDDLASALDHVELATKSELVHIEPLVQGLPFADVVKASLLRMRNLKTSFAFLQARRILKSCGSASLGRQLLLDRLIVSGCPRGSLCISLDEDNPITRVARLAAGLCKHPPCMRHDMVSLREHRAAFVVTMPDDSGQIANKHRLIASRRACSWSCFDMLSVGVFDGGSADALQLLEGLATAAATFALAAGWSCPTMFLRCYPLCAANVPHIHVVDLGASGAEAAGILSPWDLPVDEALAALREEAANEKRLLSLSVQRASTCINDFYESKNDIAKVVASEVALREGSLDDLARGASLRDASGKMPHPHELMIDEVPIQSSSPKAAREIQASGEREQQAAIKIQALQRGRAVRLNVKVQWSPGNPSFGHTAKWSSDSSDAMQTARLKPSTVVATVHKSASTQTSDQLENAMDQLMFKLEKVRSSTQQAVATLCNEGFYASCGTSV